MRNLHNIQSDFFISPRHLAALYAHRSWIRKYEGEIILFKDGRISLDSYICSVNHTLELSYSAIIAFKQEIKENIYRLIFK